MSAAVTAAARAYLATLSPRETRGTCTHLDDCDADAVGIGVNPVVGVVIGRAPMVCAAHARRYRDLAPLPPRLLALRALVAAVSTEEGAS